MSFVFISYSTKDSEYVYKLSDELERLGFSVWFSAEEINYGQKWFEAISQAIEACGAVIVVMTSNSVKSIWVEKEIHLALKYDKPIFPFLLEGSPFEILIDIHYVKIEAQNNFMPPMRFFQQLARCVEKAPLYSHSEIEERLAERLLTIPVKEDSAPVQVADPPRLPADPTVYSQIAYWNQMTNNNPNDFYCLAMLALSYELEGSSHIDAIRIIRKAIKLEPRIKNSVWMISQFGWSEKENRLLEQLLTSPHYGP